jgi:membrane associated rhomboid family serine protease
LNSTEKVVVPLLIVQVASVILLWSFDALPAVSQKIFALFLGADLLAFGLMAHIYVNMKTDSATRSVTVMVWWLLILAFFVAGFIVS